MISHQLPYNQKNTLLSKICRIGKRTFILANCGPVIYPTTNTPPIEEHRSDNYENQKDNQNPSFISTHEEDIPIIPQKKKFKPDIESCRSRIASESDEVKANEIPDVTGELLQNLKANSLWKNEQERTKGAAPRKASNDSDTVLTDCSR